MRSVILLVGLLVWSSPPPASGQQDSLSAPDQQLAGTSGQERLRLLLDLADRSLIAQPERAQAHAEEALELAEELDDPRAFAEASFALARVDQAANRLKRAARHVEDGLEAAREIGDQPAELEGLLLLAGIYQRGGRNKRLAETELAYRQLKSKMDLQRRNEELALLKGEYDSLGNELHLSESEKASILTQKDSLLLEKRLIQDQLSMTVEEKLRKDKELERMGRIRAELELKARQLEVEAAKNALAISEKEKEILEYDALVKRQQFLQILTGIGLLLSLLVLAALYWAYIERRKRNAERLALQKQLLVQEKLASLGQLTAGIAHEIKNPLNFVNNFAEGSREMVDELEELLAENQHQLPPGQQALFRELIEELQQNATDIVSNGQRMDRIVRSMMEHARGEKGRPQPVRINELVTDAVNLAYHGYRATHPDFNTRIEKKLSPGLPEIEAVGQDLSRVLINIVNNACYALHRKQRESGTADFLPTLQVSTREREKGIEVRLRDNGPGIPREAREKIFAPFFTTKPTGEGNIGLGLSISYDIIVQEHRGTLQVQSREGAFTEFIIWLPRKLGETEDVPAIVEKRGA